MVAKVNVWVTGVSDDTLVCFGDRVLVELAGRARDHWRHPGPEELSAPEDNGRVLVADNGLAPKFGKGRALSQRSAVVRGRQIIAEPR